VRCRPTRKKYPACLNLNYQSYRLEISFQTRWDKKEMTDQSRRLAAINDNEQTDSDLEETKLSWMKIQDDLKTKLILGDTEEWQKQR